MIHPKNTLAAAVAQPPPEGAPTRDWLERSALAMAEGFIVNVTPAMAETWLKQNDANRKFRRAHARTLAEEMRSGQWRLTHQGIAFGTSGRLLDGQHRLAAIADSGTTQPMLVFVNAPEEGFANFDRGAVRGVADVLLRDQKLVTVATTLARLCVRGGSNDGRRAVPAEVLAVLEGYASDIEAQNQASAAQRPGRTLSAIRGAWWVHHHAADAAGRALLCEQWRAFAELDHRAMDETTASGDRRLDHFKAIRGGALEVETACIGWLMFDPARRDLERVLIRQSSTAIDEMRAAVRLVVPGLWNTPSAATSRGGVINTMGTKRGSVMSDPVEGPRLRAMAREA